MNILLLITVLLTNRISSCRYFLSAVGLAIVWGLLIWQNRPWDTALTRTADLAFALAIVVCMGAWVNKSTQPGNKTDVS